MKSFSSFTKTIAATGLGLASAVCATLPAQAFTLTFDPGFGTSNNQGEEFEYDRTKEVPEPSVLAGLGLAFGTMLKISRRKQNA
ncbi:MAG: PEP-CTERM sorting domain-containing protein [Desertifilum sp. SIO1I2]|nr:PEP-CTERM sorting domain-containing protein [Desertifilum sp. SIO1I2]